MGTKYITINQKAKWTPIMIERDFPNDQEHICLYCEQRFIEHDSKYCKEWDHLNNNAQDNRVENMAWAHAICNERKKFNPDYQIIASEKLKKNVKWHSDLLREGDGARNFSAHKETSDEADVSAVLIKHATQFLAQELTSQNGKPPQRNEIPLKEAVECVDYLVKKEIGRGSHAAVQRHLETLSCTISEEYGRKTVNGKQIIFRREGL